MSLQSEIQKLETLLTDQIDRQVALTIHQQITKRIFDDGKDAQGLQIGRYTKEYVKRRQRKGLGSNRKVILEFTGQMRNDFVLIEDNGELGSGFNNNFNFEKSEYVEETYNKSIFEATEDEVKLFQELLDNQINNILNG